MSIDFTKPVQTRDGHSVRILCTDAHCTSGDEAQPIVGIVIDHHCPMAWCLDGRYYGGSTETSDLDLVNVPPPKTKVQVEVRLVQTSDGVEAYAKCANGFDVWWPHEEDEEVIASTTIEMEYQP